MLRAQRDQLRGDGAEDHRAADSGDRAEAMRRADDVFRIDDRISEINHLLATGTVVRPRNVGGALTEGNTVTLRYPDGEQETFYASSIRDTAPQDGTELLGLGSPLARALGGHVAGDTVTWITPTGSHQAYLVKID
jgi:transcription elongation factor GreA